MNLLKSAAIGLAVLLAAGLVFLLVMQMAGTGLLDSGTQIREQGNHWLLPVRFGVYAWTVWWLPKRSGFTGARLKQVRMTLAGMAMLIELVAVQRLFLL
ncbi:MAG: hypothetical protein F4X92_00150 [Gammaproteobacteria bacterium]|nr:hypothetical protein [Gammaproteobacteria bacterium]